MQPLRVYSEHVDAVTSVLFLSTDFNLLLSGSRDQALHVWHVEQHGHDAHQPVQEHIMDNDEETSSQSGPNKHKRTHKPRPNRVERERKRAAKVKDRSSAERRVHRRLVQMVTSENTLDADDPMVLSTSSIMGSCE